jgi:hypothetical protein
LIMVQDRACPMAPTTSRRRAARAIWRLFS